MDFHQYRVDLARQGLLHQNITQPQWVLEYSARAAYNLTDLSPASWYGLSQRLQTDPQLLQFYNLQVWTRVRVCSASGCLHVHDDVGTRGLRVLSQSHTTAASSPMALIRDSRSLVAGRVGVPGGHGVRRRLIHATRPRGSSVRHALRLHHDAFVLPAQQYGAGGRSTSPRPLSAFQLHTAWERLRGLCQFKASRGVTHALAAIPSCSPRDREVNY